MARKLTDKQKETIEEQITGLLHRSRHDSRRTGKLDTTRNEFDEHCPFFNMALGMLDTLKLLGIGWKSQYEFDNIVAWFERLKKRVLVEENFAGNNECDYCLKVFGEDGAGRKPWTKDKAVKVTPPHLRAQEEKAKEQKNKD